MANPRGNILFGASLSSKACAGFGIEPSKVLVGGLKDLGIKRYRLMTYWDECEAQQGVYDFSAVHILVRMIEKHGGEVTLCVGLRQPRWPECHGPAWLGSSQESLKDKVLQFLERAVAEFDNYTSVKSYQLENEALNRGIGTCTNFSRKRLRSEFRLLSSITKKPIIMSTSNSWGIPIIGPIPDEVGISLYRHQWGPHGLSVRHRSAIFVRVRAMVIRNLLRRPVFCHELQLEPWGPVGTQDLPDAQQRQLMNSLLAEQAIEYARSCSMQTVDMWGLEWWYWRRVQHSDPEMWSTIKECVGRYG